MYKRGNRYFKVDLYNIMRVRELVISSRSIDTTVAVMIWTSLLFVSSTVIFLPGRPHQIMDS